ncbi:hypothetical protein [Methanopyrus sp.]
MKVRVLPPLLLASVALLAAPVAATEMGKETTPVDSAGVHEETIPSERMPSQVPGALLPSIGPKALGYIAMGGLLCAIPNLGAQELGTDLTRLGVEALALATSVDYDVPIRYYLAYEYNRTYEDLSSLTYWSGICFDAAATVGVNFAFRSALQQAATDLGVPPDVLEDHMVRIFGSIAKLRTGPVSAEDLVPLVDLAARILGVEDVQRQDEVKLAGVMAVLLNNMRTSPGLMLLSDFCGLIHRYLDVNPSNGMKRWIGALLAPLSDILDTFSAVREFLDDINGIVLGFKAFTDPAGFIRETAETAVGGAMSALEPLIETITESLGVPKETAKKAAEEVVKELKSWATSVVSGATVQNEPMVRTMGLVVAISSAINALNSLNRLIRKLSGLALMARCLGVPVPSPDPEGELKRALNVLQQGRVGPPPLPF